MRGDSTFVRHGPCESCGSSDANGEFSDGHTHCFACGKTCRGEGVHIDTKPKRPIPLLDDLMISALPKRGITEETCRRWRYKIGTDGGRAVQVAEYLDDEGVVLTQKLRTADKDFRVTGKTSKHSELLYGRNLWKTGGKSLILTEGEIDAMSVSQIQDHKWPVVSVPTGATGAEKAVRANLEWVDSFDRVVFMFDMDAEGQKAAIACAALLTPGKAHIASLPLKDANELLVAGRSAEVVNAFWNARPFRPDGIVAGTDLWDKITKFENYESIDYPWAGLNTLTRGQRKGELVTVIGGTGVGKSEITRHMAAWNHDTHKTTVGYIALEESIQRTCLGMMGLHLGKRLHVDPTQATTEELKEAFDATIGSGRYFLLDHWGSSDPDSIVQRVRYMAKGLGCTDIILDHISIVVSGLETNDERKAIDVAMTKLRKLVEELQIRLFVVCHLRRDNNADHEGGDEVSLNHIRGSGCIAQVSNFVIAVERPEGGTLIRVLKNRHTGDIGVACRLKYDKGTGRFSELAAAEFEEPAEENTDKGAAF